MLQCIIQSYKPHSIVLDNPNNQIIRTWPPPNHMLSEWCNTNIVEVDTSSFLPMVPMQQSVNTTTTPTKNISLQHFDKHYIAPAVGRWRSSTTTYELFNIGIGLTPGTLFQPTIQQSLYVTKSTTNATTNTTNATNANHQNHNESNTNPFQLSIPSMLSEYITTSTTTNIIRLSLAELQQRSIRYQQHQPIFNEKNGSESQALLAVARLLHSFPPISKTKPKNLILDCNPSKIGIENILNYLKVGSLSKRILIDLLLGHRKNPTTHCTELYAWIEWLSVLQHQQCMATSFHQTSMVSAYAIYHLISKYEYQLFQFKYHNPKYHLFQSKVRARSIVPRVQLIQLLWETMTNGANNDAAQASSFSSTSSTSSTSETRDPFCFAGALEQSHTQDSAFNSMQSRLRCEGQLHPLLFGCWVSRIKTLLRSTSLQSSSYVAFDFIVRMLDRYLLGGSNDFDVVLCHLVDILDTVQHFEIGGQSEAAIIGRDVWEEMVNVSRR